MRTYPFLIALDYTQTKIVMFNTVTHSLLDLVKLSNPGDMITSLSLDEAVSPIVIHFITLQSESNAIRRSWYN